jgi:hypothetical protein
MSYQEGGCLHHIDDEGCAIYDDEFFLKNSAKSLPGTHSILRSHVFPTRDHTTWFLAEVQRISISSDVPATNDLGGEDSAVGADASGSRKEAVGRGPRRRSRGVASPPLLSFPLANEAEIVCQHNTTFPAMENESKDSHVMLPSADASTSTTHANIPALGEPKKLDILSPRQRVRIPCQNDIFCTQPRCFLLVACCVGVWVCVYVCACVRACARARMRACVHACMRVCVRLCLRWYALS